MVLTFDISDLNLFYLTEFIVRNSNGLRHQIAKIQEVAKTQISLGWKGSVIIVIIKEWYTLIYFNKSTYTQVNYIDILILICFLHVY